MSFITGKPFVDKVLSGLESSELARLQTLINNPAPVLAGTYRTYKIGSLPENTLSSIVANNGYFKYVNFSYDPVSQTYLKGILCKTSDGYAFFSWEPFSKVMTGGVVEQNHYSPRLEQLTTEEFRRVLADLLIEKGEVEGYVTEDELKEKAAIVIETENITGLSKAQLDSLKPGDIVNKITGNAKHSYRVSYKGAGAGQGICLTYVDAGYMETVSYDRSGSNWVYNSTDVKEVLGKNENIQVNGITSTASITAKTISQSEANYEFDFTSLIKPVSQIEENFESVGVPFAKIKVINGMLHIICLCAFRNKTESSSSFTLGQITINNIPENIGQFIYDAGGKKLTEQPVAGLKTIRLIPCVMNSGAYVQTIQMEHYDTNKISLYQPTNVTVSAGNIVTLTFEVNLTII